MPVPQCLRTDGFALRLIVAADAELDHAALMESREYLRLWEQSSWPEDDFTVADNRKDLEKLEKWNADHLAFTYTMVDPHDTRCLGCFNLFPTDAALYQKAQIRSLERWRWDECEAAV